MSGPNRHGGVVPPGQPWGPGGPPPGVTCPTCGLKNEAGARTCRNCGLPVAAQDDPLRGVTPGNVEMPSAQRSGVSATIGLGLVVVLLLVAGTLAVSGGGILDGGGRIGVAPEDTPIPTSAPDDTDGTDTGGVDVADDVDTPTEKFTHLTDFTCGDDGIFDKRRGKWLIDASSAKFHEGNERIAFDLRLRTDERASTGSIVRMRWLTPSEVRETYGLDDLAGQRMLVLTFDGAITITSNSRIDAAELESSGTPSIRTVRIFDGDGGDVRAVIGLRGDGCARLAAPKWKDKKDDPSVKVFVDIEPA